MTWPSSGSRSQRVWQGPSSVRRTSRISLNLPDEADKPDTCLEEWAWPDGCRLGPLEQTVVDKTHREGEVPCFGCPSAPECEARQDENIRATAELMGVELADLVLGGGNYRKCACGSFVRQWEVLIPAWARRWVCRSPLRVRVVTETGTEMKDTYCKRVHDQPAKGPKLGAGDLHSGGLL